MQMHIIATSLILYSKLKATDHLDITQWVGYTANMNANQLYNTGTQRSSSYKVVE